ncbi:hypothetical protein C8Q80DRAFT_442491 [Daedaleopsis nitida]|nr:hypothetical protein C8Q80DRAFT_442491 [Daedaleopsis nitida]
MHRLLRACMSDIWMYLTSLHPGRQFDVGDVFTVINDCRVYDTPKELVGSAGSTLRSSTPEAGKRPRMTVAMVATAVVSSTSGEPHALQSRSCAPRSECSTPSSPHAPPGVALTANSTQIALKDDTVNPALPLHRQFCDYGLAPPGAHSSVRASGGVNKRNRAGQSASCYATPSWPDGRALSATAGEHNRRWKQTGGCCGGRSVRNAFRGGSASGW